MRKSPLCCGGKLIDDLSVKTCCRDRIILRSLAPFCKRMSKCGRHSLYNRKSQRCCKGHVIPRSVKCKRLRCKRKRYYPFNEKCCNGKVIPKYVPCSLFPTQCGGASYDPSFQKCCFSRVVPRHVPCLAGRPCGHAFYNPQRQQCCNGKVIHRFRRCPVPAPHHQFCGGNFINPSF